MLILASLLFDGYTSFYSPIRGFGRSLSTTLMLLVETEDGSVSGSSSSICLALAVAGDMLFFYIFGVYDFLDWISVWGPSSSNRFLFYGVVVFSVKLSEGDSFLSANAVLASDEGGLDIS